MEEDERNKKKEGEESLEREQGSSSGEKGGPGSGHRGHLGRPGRHGGSLPSVSAYQAADLGTGPPMDPAVDAGMSEGTQYGWDDASEYERRVVKKEIVIGLSEETGIPYDDVNEVIKQWSVSANDTDMRSLAIQKDASEEFGLPMSEFTASRIVQAKDPNRWVDEGGRQALLWPSEQATLLKAMHARTQEWFKDRGFGLDDTVTLYRGIKLPADTVLSWKGAERVPIVGNTLESWSISQETATWFAGYTLRSVVLATRVPVRSILATCRTGFGCLTEGEVVVLDGLPGEATVVRAGMD